MSKIEQAWVELQKLPESEQDIAAAAILDFAARDRDLELSDEQVAEVERRMADPNPKYLTLAQVREHFKKLGV
jgi:hypothetical protein